MKALLPIILIVSSIGLYFVHIKPALGEVQILVEKEAEFDRALEAIAKVEIARDRLTATFESISPEDLDRLGTFLPTYVNDEELVLDIDAIAKKHKMKVAGVTVKEEANNAGLPGELPIKKRTATFSVTGTYPDFVAFINTLETSLQVMDVTSIDFNPNSDSPAYQLGITVYSFTQ